MPSSQKFQPNPFPFLMYTEWVMLLSCGSLAILEAINGQYLPIQHISILVILCLMGWMLPTNQSAIKSPYTLAETDLVYYSAILGYLHILPTLYLIVFIRSCFLFGTVGCWMIGGLSFVLFFVHQTINIGDRNLTNRGQRQSISPSADSYSLMTEESSS